MNRRCALVQDRRKTEAYRRLRSVDQSFAWEHEGYSTFTKHELTRARNRYV